MKLEALERQSGVYGTVNAGDTVTVSDQLGEELVALGAFKKVNKEAAPATADEVQDRKASGDSVAPIHTDGTERELLNTVGRKLHEPQADQIVPAQQEIEEKAQEADADAAEVADEKAHQDKVAEQKAVKEAKAASGRQTKVDKEAGTESTK